MMLASPTQTMNTDELQRVLEPLIRRVVREELDRISRMSPNLFSLEADMPLYRDLEEIAQRNAHGGIELFSHQEVWG